MKQDVFLSKEMLKVEEWQGVEARVKTREAKVMVIKIEKIPKPRITVEVQ